MDFMLVLYIVATLNNHINSTQVEIFSYPLVLVDLSTGSLLLFLISLCHFFIQMKMLQFTCNSPLISLPRMMNFIYLNFLCETLKHFKRK